jgi:hypothetical protein
VVTDADATMRRCAERLALFSELPAPWAEKSREKFSAGDVENPRPAPSPGRT